jgi:hypothetical protein
LPYGEKEKYRKSKLRPNISKKIQEYVTKRNAEKIIEVSNMKNRKNVWFLPHFSVFNPKKPGV